MYRKLIALATCLAVAALCWPIAANAREEEQGKVKKIMEDRCCILPIRA